MKKKVYIALSLDIIHHGHINLIEKASKFGELTVGLLTDKAIASNKKVPILNFQQRKKILQNLKGIKNIVEQDTWSYSKNILKYKPDIFVHGDDWKKSENGRKLRNQTIAAIKKVKCKLIEIDHTKDVSSTSLRETLSEQVTSKIQKQNYLLRVIKSKDICRILETHSPLSAIIAEHSKYKNKKGKILEFDGFWSSSLTDSTLIGKPDIEVLDLNQRLINIQNIFDVTTKPLIMDIDTGGKLEHFVINIKSIERSGVSAVIMEDKKGLKKNSLFGVKVKQEQDGINEFSKKIKEGKKLTKNLMIIARVESLILNKPVSDAIKRAYKYVEAGADGIMIHSKSNTPNEIFKFAKIFKKTFEDIPLIAVPSSYNKVREEVLINNGFNVVIYANHMLRASYPAMRNVALDILRNRRSYDSDKNLLSIKEILNLIPGTN
jgi:phosphoenolpyruvate mutase